MIRQPIVAGQFYDYGYNELDKQITSCFEGERGPGTTPIKRKSTSIRAVISPHAGYLYSGECAAWAYKEIAESAFPDVYVVMGPSHQGFGTCISREDWKTPLGTVKTDRHFCDAFEKVSGITADETAHAGEHSIEVQLPLLQFASKDKTMELKIMPLLVSNDMEFGQIAKAIAEAEKASGKRAVIICSSDFTHYGRAYHYVPFTDDVEKRMYELDGKALEMIKKKDVKGFIELLNSTHTTICGFYPILSLLSLLKDEKGEVLHYYTSGDVSGDYKTAVGYAAVVFR